MKLGSFFPPENLDKIRGLKKGSGFPTLVRAIQKLLVKIGNLLGLEVGISVPENLRDYDPQVWRAFRVMGTLTELGIAEDVPFLTKTQYPDEPQSHLLMIKISGEQKMGYAGTGIDLLDKSKTVWKAVGEALERWAIHNFSPQDSEIVRSSYRDLNAGKLDIFSIVGFESNLRKSGIPNCVLDFNQETVFKWIRGHSLFSDTDTYIPLQLVSFSYASKVREEKQEPILSPVVSTGAASGQTITDAILNGLLEIIERDAFMIHWLNQIPSDRIKIETIPDARFSKLQEIFKRYRLEVHLLHLKTDVPVHTVLGVVIDRSGVGPAVMVGANSAFDLVDAAYGALNEAVGFRSILRDIMKRDMDKTDFSKRDTIGHKERMLYWSQYEKIKDIEVILKGGLKDFDWFPEYPSRESSSRERLETITSSLKEKKYEIVYKEIIDKRVSRKLDGLTTVVVFVPEFQPLHLHESLPAFAGKRVSEIPMALGFKALKKVHRDPHPFP